MKKKLLNTLLVGSLFLTTPATYSEVEETATQTKPIFVTATRTAASEESIGKSFTAISGEQLQEDNDLSVIDALRQVPGVRVQQLGGPGTFTNVRLRGLRSNDTQLLINGLPFRDAADPQGAIGGVFQDFRADFLSQIDVVRGANSTLFGSDAIGGSINLVPERPMGKPSVEIGFEGGTLNTYRQTYAIKGGEELLSYLIGYSRTTSDGIDSNDDYNNNNYSVFLTSNPTDKVEIKFDFIGSDTELDLNEGATLVGGKLVTAADDPNDFRESEFFFYGTHIKYQATDNWEHIIRFGAVDSDRKFVFRTDPDGTDFPSNSEFNGNTYNIEYQSNLQVNDQHLVTFGYEYEYEEFESIARLTTGTVKETPGQYRNSWYLQDQINFLDESLFVTGGIRITDHETAGTDVNGEGSVAYLIKETGTKLHSHIGTGFRAPALFELFGASTFGGVRTVFGNKNLDPEDSLSWDIGVEQQLFDGKAVLDATFFSEDVDDIIVFGATGYTNISNAKSHGFEVDLDFTVNEKFSGRAFYTYTDSEDSFGAEVFGIPEHIWGLDFLVKLCDKAKLLIRGTYYDKQDFTVFVFAPTAGTVRVESDDYFKVDAVVSYQVSKNVEAYVRVENLFDEEIVENGFEGSPALVFGGIKIKI